MGTLSESDNPDKIQQNATIYHGPHCLPDKKKFQELKYMLIWKFYSGSHMSHPKYSKTCVKRPLKNRQNKDLNDKW